VGSSRSDAMRRPPSRASDEPACATVEVSTRTRARLFVVGRSQAVRLPKACRFPGTEVLIRRSGQSVVLEPVAPSQWPAGYWESVDAKQDILFGGCDRSRS
jgi:antitoxin VapB